MDADIAGLPSAEEDFRQAVLQSAAEDYPDWAIGDVQSAEQSTDGRRFYSALVSITPPDWETGFAVEYTAAEGEPPTLLEHVLCAGGVLGPDAAAGLLEQLDQSYTSQGVRITALWSTAAGEVDVAWDPGTSSEEVSAERPPSDTLIYDPSAEEWVPVPATP